MRPVDQDGEDQVDLYRLSNLIIGPGAVYPRDPAESNEH